MAEAAIVFVSTLVLMRVLWLLDRSVKSGKPVQWGILGYRRGRKREGAAGRTPPPPPGRS